MAETDLLERDAELTELDRLLDRAVAGRGGTAVIEGPAGVGKSALLAAVRKRAAERGMAVVAARASALEIGLAFGVAHRLIGAPPGPPASGAPEDYAVPGLAEIRRLTDALASAHRGPLLLVVDDAHWADVPSLRLLGHLALRIDELPMAIAVAVRVGEPLAHSELLSELSSGPDTVVLRPRSLSEDAVEQVVIELLGAPGSPLASACARATGGNPFYLRAMLRALEAEPQLPNADAVVALVPPAVVESILARCGRLGPEAEALARAAAVLGDGTSLQLTAGLAGLACETAERAADALARAGILAPGEPLAFTHPIVRSALECGMGSFERARAHWLAAKLLIAARAAEQRIAAHLLQTPPHDDPQAVAVLVAAAEAALAGGDPGCAAQLLERALQEPPPPAQRGAIVLALARAEALAGSPLGADRLDDALAELERGAPRAAALEELAMLCHFRGEFGRAAALAAHASEELAPGAPARERLLAIELGASWLTPELADGVAAKLTPVVERTFAGDPPRDPALRALVVMALSVGGPVDLCRRLAEDAIAHDPLIDRDYGSAVGWIASALLWADQLDLHERWLDEAVRLAEQRPGLMTLATIRLQRSWGALLRGRLRAAVADAERALVVFGHGWTSWTWSTPTLARAHAALGEPEQARAALALGERAGPAAADRVLLVEARAEVALAEGDAKAALASARAAAGLLPEDPGQARLWRWRPLAARALHQLGELDEARATIAPHLEVLRTLGPTRQLGEALLVAGLVSDSGEQVRLLEEATRTLADSPARLLRAEALVELGAALRRAGQRNAAHEPLAAGYELADEIEAAPLGRRAREELTALGLRPRRAARHGVAALTPGERRVAQLAADGLTTRQIAARLHVSANTVATHLAHTYRKLAVGNRADLAAALGAIGDAGLGTPPPG